MGIFVKGRLCASYAIVQNVTYQTVNDRLMQSGFILFEKYFILADSILEVL